MSYHRDRDIARFAERHGKHLRHEPHSEKPSPGLNLLKFTKSNSSARFGKMNEREANIHSAENQIHTEEYLVECVRSL